MRERTFRPGTAGLALEVGSQRREILPLQPLFLHAGLRSHFFPAEEARKSLVPPAAACPFCRRRRFDIPPQSCRGALRGSRTLCICSLAGRQRGCWRGGAAAGHPGPLTCFPGTSPGQSRPMLPGTHSRRAGRIAAHSWAGSGPRQGVQFTRLRPGANSSAFVKC